MADFRCIKCKYIHRPRSAGVEAPPLRCPYCSKEGTLVRKGHILDEL